MFSSDRRSVTQLAKLKDFPRDTMEKVLRLAHILKELETGSFKPFRLVLKGGTALQFVFFGLRRLSVDIDMDIDLELTLAQMQETRMKLEKEIKAMMESEGYLFVTDSRFHHALSSLSFQYTNLFGGRDRIEIEINYVNRVHILEPIRKTVSIDGIPDFSVLVLQPKELFATKIAALIGRGKPRDIYDVWLIDKSDYNTPDVMADLRRYALFYIINSMTIGEKTDLYWQIQDQKERINNTESETFYAALRSVIRRSDPIDQTELTVRAFRMIDTLFNNLETQVNAYFSAFKKGIFNPGLLFLDSPWNQAIEHHPMALWKANQIKETTKSRQ